MIQFYPDLPHTEIIIELSEAKSPDAREFSCIGTFYVN